MISLFKRMCGLAALSTAALITSYSAQAAAPVPCSDTFGYTCADVTSSYTPVAASNIQTGDDYWLSFTIPFAFPFYGGSYTTIHASSNGIITFLGGTSQFGNQDPTTQPFNRPSISAFWDDLYFFGDGHLVTETRGTAPNRQYVVEWRNVGFFFDPSGPRVTIQAILNENGDIQFNYADIGTHFRETGASASIGLTGVAPNTGLTYSFNQPTVTNGLGILFTAPIPDVAGPTIQINSPPNAATYLLSQTVTADYSCSDDSGVATCAGPVANGAAIDTSTVGSKSFKVDATDTLGNASSQTNAYAVVYNFTGFFAPVDKSTGRDRIMNATKAGQSVPIKFSLSGDQSLDILFPGYPASKNVSCSETTSTDPLEEVATPGSSGLAYDPTTDRYTLVWKTEKAWTNTCRILVVKLKDGTEHNAYFRFNK